MSGLQSIYKNSLLVFCGVTLALVVGETLAMQTVKLSSGHEMPIIGLGTWQIKPEDIDKSVMAALESGYKHIDTAFIYRNEEAIGKSLKKYFEKGGKREDLFITTKLPPIGHRDVENYLKLSLEQLGLQYVDMYLIHTPFSIIGDEKHDTRRNTDESLVLDLQSDHLSTWKQMEAQVKAGRAQSIGLSNFNETQILRILNNAEIKPSNLQIELQAYNQQKALRELCAKNGIAVTGYSTLGSPASEFYKTGKGKTLPKLLENPVVTKIAEKRKKTTAQVLLRHSVQNGVIVIPKSTNPERIKANIDIFDFELTKQEMEQINKLDKGEDGRLIDFLVFKGVEAHPEYPFVKKSKA